MENYTRRHVLKAWEQLAKLLPPSAQLDSYHPGNRVHYRVTVDGGRTPFGNAWWIGSKEAYYGIHLIADTLYFAERKQDYQ